MLNFQKNLNNLHAKQAILKKTRVKLCKNPKKIHAENLLHNNSRVNKDTELNKLIPITDFRVKHGNDKWCIPLVELTDSTYVIIYVGHKVETN